MDQHYRVVLTAKGQDHMRYVRGLRKAFKPLLVLVEALTLAEQVDPPFVLLDGVDLAQAESSAEVLRDHGAEVEIQNSDYPTPMRFYRPDISSPKRPSLRETMFPTLFSGKS